MQSSIIESVNEISKEGKTIFFAIKFQDKTEATSFDTKIKDAERGDTLEWEPFIKKGFINIKEGWKLTKSSQPSTANKGLPPDADVNARCAVSSVLGINGIDALPVDTQLGRVVSKALKWAEDAIDKATPRPPAKQQAANNQGGYQTPDDDSPVKHVGDLLSRCQTVGIDRAKLLDILGLTDVCQIVLPDQAWQLALDFAKKEAKKEE